MARDAAARVEPSTHDCSTEAQVLAYGREVLAAEAGAIAGLVERLDRSYREVCEEARRAQATGSGNHQVTMVPVPRSLSADTLPT